MFSRVHSAHLTVLGVPIEVHRHGPSLRHRTVSDTYEVAAFKDPPFSFFLSYPGAMPGVNLQAAPLALWMRRLGLLSSSGCGRGPGGSFISGSGGFGDIPKGHCVLQ